MWTAKKDEKADEDAEKPNIRFAKHLKAACDLEMIGVDVYEACLAKEYDRVIYCAHKKLGRSATAKGRLQSDMYDLYMIAVGAFRESHGASTPKEIAEAVVSAYMQCGMDLARTALFTRTEGFAIRIPASEKN